MIAKNWGVPPHLVDLAPRDEVETELLIMQLEAETKTPSPAANKGIEELFT